MTLYVENETDFEFPFSVEELLGILVKNVLAYENCPFSDVTVSLSITDDNGIREINKNYRNTDKATDVLSFPAINYETPGDFSFIDANMSEYFDMDTNDLILGDIMLSVDHIINQAKEYGHSILRETAFLIVHSLLHLCGYDHMDDSERKIMEDKQDEILNQLAITRECDDSLPKKH